jgi:hypothetical protein
MFSGMGNDWESTEEGRGGFVSNFFSEEAPRVLEKEMAHPSCQLWCGYSLKAATATRSLVQAEAELDFPPAIPLELLMRARCALVQYSDSFSDRSLLGGVLGLQSPTLQNQPPPPPPVLRTASGDARPRSKRWRGKFCYPEARRLLCHLRHD